MQREKVKELTVKMIRACKMLNEALSTLYEMNSEYELDLTSLENDCAKEEILAWVDDAKNLLEKIHSDIELDALETILNKTCKDIHEKNASKIEDNDTADKTDDDPLSEFMFQ